MRSRSSRPPCPDQPVSALIPVTFHLTEEERRRFDDLVALMFTCVNASRTRLGKYAPMEDGVVWVITQNELFSDALDAFERTIRAAALLALATDTDFPALLAPRIAQIPSR